MNRPAKKVISIVLITFLVLTLFYYITGTFQVYNKPIQSKNLLLEGWLPQTIIDKAAQYIINNDIDSIWIVNVKDENNNYSNTELVNYKRKKIEKRRGKLNLYWSGILTYKIPAEKIDDTVVLKIGMYGSEVQNIYPHYKVFVNNKPVKTGFVTGSDSTYFFSFSKSARDTIIDLMINFDNDAKIKDSDRNLYITNVLIDDIKIENIASQRLFMVTNNKASPFFDSNAENTKLYLSDFGIDADKIRILETDYTTSNKTLILANLAGDFFQNSNIKDINIFATSPHSRRTYLNFRNCINQNIELGCIVSDPENSQKWSEFYSNFDERASLIFTWMYWWFH